MNQDVLKITGKLLKTLPQVKRGQYLKTPFVIMSGDKYEREIYFEISDQRSEAFKTVKPGTELTVYFNARSVDFNGKYYTNLDAWKWEV